MPRGVPRDPSVKRKILHRLKIARGHLDHVIRMVEQDEYCIDVLNQSQAVQKALKNADNALLECHLKCCVPEAIERGESQKVVDEIVSTFKRS